MKKKMLIIIGAIVLLFAVLYFVVDYKNQQATDGDDNPYGTDDLHQATIDQLDDPDYQNQIMPDELAAKLNDGADMMVYFYDPTCSHCQELTPRLMTVVEDMGVDMKKLNLLEFKDGWSTYGIEGTPTLVYFEDGQEANRVSGAKSNDVFRSFFNEYAINDANGGKDQAG